ncbi:Protein mpe1 [Ophidiomyces ophidiicola]|nr:Protein mpe1 [Ophidiomyces ophidiicola]
MTSSVHFKFKSQREPSRVSFDGTGISVFELKREIINQNQLGDGSDFDLAIYHEDTGEEYNDDTAIIPRSTSIIARRLPASRPGKGAAARYISGKMPVTARPSIRVDLNGMNRPGNNPCASIPDLDIVQSEEEKIRAVLNFQESQWKEQQEDMATATPISSSRNRALNTNAPDHPPPPGYLCYRCREKGHWIQACPTNNDPRFDGRYRVKRSTGIPRSFQKQVDKPESRAFDKSSEDPKLSGVMVNADGDFVIAEPDKASWELYQEKAKASAAAAAELAAIESTKGLQSRNLLCPSDKRMFLAPTKTPCCGSTYCNDCITNALIESDFVCPGCNAEGVLLDNLSVDEDAILRIKEYEAEQADYAKQGFQPTIILSPNQKGTSGDSSHLATDLKSKIIPKRPADDAGNHHNETLPAVALKKARFEDPSNYARSTDVLDSITNPSTIPFRTPFNPFGTSASVDHSSCFPPPFASSGGLWNQSSNINFVTAAQPSLYHQNMIQSMVPMGGPISSNIFAGQGFMPMPGQMFQPFPVQQPNETATFSNQQRTTFSEPFAKEEDNAYFRQPVNPHRHQAKQKRLRPSDYREL